MKYRVGSIMLCVCVCFLLLVELVKEHHLVILKQATSQCIKQEVKAWAQMDLPNEQ